jgi:nickel-type superoxide dismutase maturation protease
VQLRPPSYRPRRPQRRERLDRLGAPAPALNLAVAARLDPLLPGRLLGPRGLFRRAKAFAGPSRRRLLAVATLLTALAGASWGASRLERVVVAGESMAPALLPGDRLLVRKTGRHHRRALRRGDLAVATDPRYATRLLVKRIAKVGHGVVWLAGDNAARSTDSSDFGPVPVYSVRGLAIYRYAPATRAGRLGRMTGGPAE